MRKGEDLNQAAEADLSSFMRRFIRRQEGCFFVFFLRRRCRGVVSGRSDNWVSVERLVAAGYKKNTASLSPLSIWNHIRPPSPSSTQIRRHRRSRNVRGSARTPCPHLMSGIDKRAVVLLLSWLQCLQACRQVVRHKPTLRRIKIHSRSLSDAKRSHAHAAVIKIPVLTCHCYSVLILGGKWVCQLVVLLDLFDVTRL